MNPILVLYATREGHTLHIANHILQSLFMAGLPVEERNAAALVDEEEPLDLRGYSAAILAASVHRGRHEPEMVAFVRRHRDTLSRLPSAFLSVSLSEAGAELGSSAPERRARAAADVDRMLASFYAETGWQPSRVSPVAGALQYSKYGPLLRWIMHGIVRRAGGNAELTKDQVFTDWESVDHFVAEFLTLLPAPPASTRAAQRML